MNTNKTHIETGERNPELRAYKVRFTGRVKGALGKFEQFTDIVQADSEQMAILRLYDRYDCVMEVLSVIASPTRKPFSDSQDC